VGIVGRRCFGSSALTAHVLIPARQLSYVFIFAVRLISELSHCVSVDSVRGVKRSLVCSKASVGRLVSLFPILILVTALRLRREGARRIAAICCVQYVMLGNLLEAAVKRYLGTTLSNTNSIAEEIKSGLR
jgi:hypothetical protein